jgi:hypothetical protein
MSALVAKGAAAAGSGATASGYASSPYHFARASKIADGTLPVHARRTGRALAYFSRWLDCDYPHGIGHRHVFLPSSVLPQAASGAFGAPTGISPIASPGAGSAASLFLGEPALDVVTMAGLSLHPDPLLHSARILDADGVTHRAQALAMAQAWFGCALGPASWVDAWLLYGLCGYVTALYVRDSRRTDQGLALGNGAFNAGFGADPSMQRLPQDPEFKLELVRAAEAVARLEEEYPFLLHQALRPGGPFIENPWAFQSPLRTQYLWSKAPAVCHMLAVRVGEATFQRAVRFLVRGACGLGVALQDALAERVWIPRLPSAGLDATGSSSNYTEASMVVRSPEDGMPMQTGAIVVNEDEANRISAEAARGVVATQSFLDLLSAFRTGIRNEAEAKASLQSFAHQWIYSNGVPAIVAGVHHNRRTNNVEVVIEQIPRAGVPIWTGEMTVLVAEVPSDSDGMVLKLSSKDPIKGKSDGYDPDVYLHTVTITGLRTIAALPCHARVKKGDGKPAKKDTTAVAKTDAATGTGPSAGEAAGTGKDVKKAKSGAAGPLAGSAESKIADLHGGPIEAAENRDEANYTPVVYVVFDPELAWLKRFHLAAPPAFHLSTLAYCRDLPARLTAISSMGTYGCNDAMFEPGVNPLSSSTLDSKQLWSYLCGPEAATLLKSGHESMNALRNFFSPPPKADAAIQPQQGGLPNADGSIPGATDAAAADGENGYAEKPEEPNELGRSAFDALTFPGVLPNTPVDNRILRLLQANTAGSFDTIGYAVRPLSPYFALRRLSCIIADFDPTATPQQFRCVVDPPQARMGGFGHSPLLPAASITAMRTSKMTPGAFNQFGSAGQMHSFAGVPARGVVPAGPLGLHYRLRAAAAFSLARCVTWQMPIYGSTFDGLFKHGLVHLQTYIRLYQALYYERIGSAESAPLPRSRSRIEKDVALLLLEFSDPVAASSNLTGTNAVAFAGVDLNAAPAGVPKKLTANEVLEIAASGSPWPLWPVASAEDGMLRHSLLCAIGSIRHSDGSTPDAVLTFLTKNLQAHATVSDATSLQDTSPVVASLSLLLAQAIRDSPLATAVSAMADQNKTPTAAVPSLPVGRAQPKLSAEASVQCASLVSNAAAALRELFALEALALGATDTGDSEAGHQTHRGDEITSDLVLASSITAVSLAEASLVVSPLLSPIIRNFLPAYHPVHGRPLQPRTRIAAFVATMRHFLLVRACGPQVDSEWMDRAGSLLNLALDANSPSVTSSPTIAELHVRFGWLLSLLCMQWRTDVRSPPSPYMLVEKSKSQVGKKRKAAPDDGIEVLDDDEDDDRDEDEDDGMGTEAEESGTEPTLWGLRMAAVRNSLEMRLADCAEAKRTLAIKQAKANAALNDSSAPASGAVIAEPEGDDANAIMEGEGETEDGAGTEWDLGDAVVDSGVQDHLPYLMTQHERRQLGLFRYGPSTYGVLYPFTSVNVAASASMFALWNLIRSKPAGRDDLKSDSRFEPCGGHALSLDGLGACLWHSIFGQVPIIDSENAEVEESETADARLLQGMQATKARLSSIRFCREKARATTLIVHGAKRKAAMVMQECFEVMAQESKPGANPGQQATEPASATGVANASAPANLPSSRMHAHQPGWMQANPVAGPGAGAMGGRTAPLEVIAADGAAAAGARRVYFVDKAEHGDDEHRQKKRKL